MFYLGMDERGTLQEHAPTVIGVASVDGKFTEVNQFFCKFPGYTREEFLQPTFIEEYPVGNFPAR